MMKTGFVLVLIMATVNLGAENHSKLHPPAPLPQIEKTLWDILLFGNKIGQLTGTHQILANGTEVYELSSDSKAKILWMDKTVNSHVEVVMKDGQMISSVYKEIEDGKLKSWYNIKQNGKGYTADGHKGKKNIEMPVLFPLASIYFKAVTKAAKAFDEAGAEFVDFQSVGTDCWEFKANGGKYVLYTEKGYARKMDVHTSLVKVVMEKR